jgi:hypothetical protein
MWQLTDALRRGPPTPPTGGEAMNIGIHDAHNVTDAGEEP